MPERDARVPLLHMRDFVRKALAPTQGKALVDLEADEVLRLALTHLVELVGEAAARVPPEVQRSNPQIPWATIISMRNRLIHGYDYVDYKILWDTLTLNLPELLVKLDGMLADWQDAKS